jgi:hypothetical protein
VYLSGIINDSVDVDSVYSVSDCDEGGVFKCKSSRMGRRSENKEESFERDVYDGDKGFDIIVKDDMLSLVKRLRADLEE